MDEGHLRDPAPERPLPGGARRGPLRAGRSRPAGAILAAIAFARTLVGIDPEGIALWGTSFSGEHVIATAARDRRIAAVIAQARFVDGLATLRAAGLTRGLKLTREGLIDELHRLRGTEPHLIKTIGPPGSTAAMTSPDADSGYRALIPAQSSWRDEVSARVLLRLGLYRPTRAAAAVQCPLLVCVCDGDAINPPGAALAAAARPARRGAPLSRRTLHDLPRRALRAGGGRPGRLPYDAPAGNGRADGQPRHDELGRADRPAQQPWSSSNQTS